jgi:hypothetical protein
MAEDTRDYIERSISSYEKALGREPTPADIAGGFAKMDNHTRVSVLTQMEADRGDPQNPEPLTLNQAAKRVRFETALRNTHKALREVGR